MKFVECMLPFSSECLLSHHFNKLNMSYCVKFGFALVKTWMKLFKNRLLRKIFGREREEVAGGWRKLHSEELRNFNSLQRVVILVVKHLEKLCRI